MTWENGCVSRGGHSTQVVGFWSAIAGGGSAPEAESAIGTNRRRNQQLGGDAPLSTPNIERHKQSDHDGVAASYSYSTKPTNNSQNTFKLANKIITKARKIIFMNNF